MKTKTNEMRINQSTMIEIVQTWIDQTFNNSTLSVM